MRNTPRNKWLTPAIAAALLATACSSNTSNTAQDDPMADRKVDLATVDTTHDTGIRDAILEQHTIFPYDFEIGSAQLNSLGARDLAVLAQSFRQVGNGEINVRRGDAGDALYAARTQTVKDALTHLGVVADNVKIGDDVVGGEGASGTDAAAVLKHEESLRDAGGGASGGASGGGSASPGGAAAASTGGM